MKPELLVLLVGLISAAALPLGAVIAILFKPKPRISAALMAFGAGALLFALTIEIIAEHFEATGFWPLTIGCLLGGVSYELLNHRLNQVGAFLRKGATVVRYLTLAKEKKAQKLLERLSENNFLRVLPASEIAAILPHIEQKAFLRDEVIFKEGDPADALYIIDFGEVEVAKEGKVLARGQAGEMFGEMAVLTNTPRVARAWACQDSLIFKIPRDHLSRILKSSPGLKDSIEAIIAKRSAELDDKVLLTKGEALKWRKEAVSCLVAQDFSVTTGDIRRALNDHDSAAQGIWLGNLLDGIPESLMVGLSLTVSTAIPWAFIAGVFLANLPEALSSSVLMKNHGYSNARIIWMWGSIAILMILGVVAGSWLVNLSPIAMAILGGVAAGALLTMVSQTMLPEAFEEGGAVVGLSTLGGFLAALFVKSLA